MTPRAIIVTGGDHHHFRLAWGLLKSLSRSGLTRRYDLGFIDAGITDRERQALPDDRVAVGRAAWDFDFPTRAHLEAVAPGVRTLYGKLRMRELFPGYEVYVWIDADAWVQDPSAIPIIIDEAARNGLVAAYELDRGYFPANLSRVVWSKYRDWYGHAYGPTIARFMELKPMLNVGVYGIAATAPHWSIWEWLYRSGLRRQEIHQQASVFMTDQLSLNVAVHYHRLPVSVLPASFNWLCHLAPPMWDAEAGRLVVPAPPYETVRIVHLSGSSKKAPVTMPGRRGGHYASPLRFPPQVQPAAAPLPGTLEPVGEEEEVEA